MNHYEAKFAREAKECPVEWIIFPVGPGQFKLVHIGPPPRNPEGYTVPHLRVVK